MAKRKFTPEHEAFICGMLAALEVVTLHDAETIHREIVNLQGADELVWVARKHGTMRISGLSQYGYGTQKRRTEHANENSCLKS